MRRPPPPPRTATACALLLIAAGPFAGAGEAVPTFAPAAPATLLPAWLTGGGEEGREEEVAGGGAIRLLAPHRGGGDFAAGGLAGALTETSLMSRALRSKGRLRADAWTDFDDTTRFGGQLVATTWLRAALDAEAYAWRQDRDPDPGERLGGDFHTGDANVVAQVVSHARGTLRTGAGAAWIVDDAGTFEVGPQGTIALDANLLGQATAGFEIDYGLIGGDELFRWRAEGGWVWGPAEIRTGYDRLTLGEERRGGWFASLLLRY